MNVVKKIAYTILPSTGDVGTDNAPAKEAWLEKTLRTLPAGSKILDAGAGELAYKKFCTHLDYTSQDFGEYDGESYKTGTWDTSGVDIRSDIIAIPVPDASFDAIMCVEVFEHIPEPAKAIKEFARILKPGGTLITTAPFCSTTHQQPYYFANGFSRYWYEKILPEYGFEIQELTHNGNLFSWAGAFMRGMRARADTYSSGATLYQRLVIKLMLAVLNTWEKQNNGSEELLCFGIYVVANKK
jgi:SAM-dependent methyltransferase